MMRSDVYDQLKERLFAGELRTGQFVTQRELAELLGATMNPVREAIRQLEAEGLITVYAQRGIQIIDGGSKAINDAYEYRLLLELNALRLFATTADKDTIRGVMRKVLAEVARTGLPGSHHFFITFLTGAPGVRRRRLVLWPMPFSARLLSKSGLQGWPDLNHSALSQSIFANSGCAPKMPGSAPLTMSPNFMTGGNGTQKGAHSMMWSSQPM